MGVLESTKYKNIVRSISGLNNVVYNNDVLLLCDTSSNPVQIDLNDIPDDFWNTNYKLYIRDDSNNAGTNNITITAPTNHSIDNQQFVKLTTNGKGTVVRIGGNNSYVTNTASSTAGGCSFINVTVSEIQALILTNSIVECSYYKITDASDFDNGVILQGTSNNTVSLFGTGLFLNADYQNVGGNNVGVWNNSLSGLIAGTSICIWNGLHYLSQTGLVGTTPNGDTVNWLVLTKSVSNTYILESDDVKYNVSSDQILSRADKRGNYIEWRLNKNFDPIVKFQWGNNNVSGNTATNAGVFNILNNTNIIKNNYCDTSGFYDSPENKAIIQKNSVSNRGRLSTSDNSQLIEQNHISNNFEIFITSATIPITNFSNKTGSYGFSDFDIVIDMNDPSIYDLGNTTLTIPTLKKSFGIIALSNSNKTVTKIIGLSQVRLTKFITFIDSEITTFTTKSIGNVVTYEIVSNQAPGNILVEGRSSATDSIKIKKEGLINIIDGKPNIFI